MSSRSTEEELQPVALATRPVSPRGQWLPGAVAFGTSMLPFFRPGDEVWTEPVEIRAIRMGDVITIRLKPNRLLTHRVVKIVRQNGNLTFFTKGDNCHTWDPVVFPHQVIGRVTKVGTRGLSRPVWRWFGCLVAWFSYGQGAVYLWLKESRWNRWRHLLERKGLFPRVHLLSFYRRISSPLRWVDLAGGLHNSFYALQERRQLSHHGIQIHTWSADDVGPMTEVWNEVFPSFRTSEDRFQRIICQSPWFDPSGCLVVRKGDRLIGWAFASLRQDEAHRNAKRPSTGFIEVVALGKENQNAFMGKALIHELLTWFRSKGISHISLGPLPVQGLPYGFSLMPPLDTAAACGFQPASVLMELLLNRRDYRARTFCRSSAEVAVRPWRQGDDESVMVLLESHGYSHSDYLYRQHRARFEIPADILVAVSKNRLVGVCRWLWDEHLRHYSDVGWIWSAAQPRDTRAHIFSLVVEKSRRGQGIAPLLLAKTLEQVFHVRDCEVVIWTGKTAFYRRLGFVPGHSFLSMWCSLERL